jgi:hypothetical protein
MDFTPPPSKTRLRNWTDMLPSFVFR